MSGVLSNGSERRTKASPAPLLNFDKKLSWKSWAEKRRGLIHQSFDITCRHLFAHHYLLHMEKPCCVAWSNKNIKLKCSECRRTSISIVRTKSQLVLNLFQNDICNCGWLFNSEAAEDYIKWEFWPLMTIMLAQKNESQTITNETFISSFLLFQFVKHGALICEAKRMWHSFNLGRNNATKQEQQRYLLAISSLKLDILGQPRLRV